MRMHPKTLLVAVIAVATAGLFTASARAAPPSNTAPPTISGTLMQGRTLTGTRGTWSHSPSSFAYRWQRCAADGTGCTNIDNAAQRTYRLTATDVDNTMRFVVTASNPDGQASASSKTTDVVSANTAPKNTASPTISGLTRSGEELTADHGTWTGGVRTYAYQWERCDASGGGCVDAAGATGQTYGVRAIDVGHTLRVVVKATNLAGSTTATSAATGAVTAGGGPPPPPTPTANHRPTIRILNVRFVGARVYVRFKSCDDSRRNLKFTERDSKPGALSYVRHFRTLVAPHNCAVLTRNWLPAPRFRHGRYTITLWARDYKGLTSLPARRTLFR